MQSDSNLGGGTAGEGTSGLGSTGTGGLSGTGGSTGAGGLGGSTGAGGLSGTGGTTGGYTEGGGYSSGDDFGAHEETYRRHYTVAAEPAVPVVTPFEEARTGYEIGHTAAANPQYANREFTEVEVELEKESPGRLSAVRGYARHAFEWKTLLGALAVAGGAWWVSRKLSQAVSAMGEEEEQDCRTYYEAHPVRTTVPYEQARTVYVIGYAAARNPEYAGRPYEEVEPHLRGGFTGARAGSYDSLRDFTRRGYERGSSRAPAGGTTEYTGSTGGTVEGGYGGSTGGAVEGGYGSTGGTAGGTL